jgi:hypothetical protein
VNNYERFKKFKKFTLFEEKKENMFCKDYSEAQMDRLLFFQV